MPLPFRPAGAILSLMPCWLLACFIYLMPGFIAAARFCLPDLFHLLAWAFLAYRCYFRAIMPLPAALFTRLFFAAFHLPRCRRCHSAGAFGLCH